MRDAVKIASGRITIFNLILAAFSKAALKVGAKPKNQGTVIVKICVIALAVHCGINPEAAM
jgi:hypothetical protein